ncbi:beta-ketoacyl-[acyl-carrier-protein] synthase family protein [Lysinibacillus sp. NPDC093712]|uniref:beta-ketoacyl-[acyl-carrier-protein] synthase family protein n=1 Tax=Lysinibacillus sp. NPDC093712 TaxID=3390579 RepID=UPI003D0296B0
MAKSSNRVVVTGLGIVAPNGYDKETFCQALLSGQTGIGSVERIDMSDFRTQLAGEVKISFPEMAKEHNYDRTISLACLALNEALIDSGMDSTYLSSLGPRAGMSFATSLGGNSRMMEYLKEEIDERRTQPEWLADLNLFSNYIAKYAGVKGNISSTTSACAAGTAAAGIGFDQIRLGRADVMIIGGSDPLTEFSIAGFHSLRSLSPTASKPFDEDRDGLVIGEGASIIILENYEHALQRGAHIYAEIMGYGLSNDAYHVTSPDPNGGGAIRAMEMALRDAGLKPEDVDYINAHGTSTIVNDKMELNAIRQVFHEHAYKIAISSTKSMTGHCLGAAGSIELAACILALEGEFIPPTATLEKPEEGFREFRLIKTKGRKEPIKVAMSNSFAFGGNTACVVLKTID